MLETAQNVLICKKILDDHFPDDMNTDIMKPVINPPFVHWLCNQVQKIFQEEPNVIETRSPTDIVGDIHGQFDDLITVFKLGGIPSNQRYIFLGDYIDRGENSLEVICLLFMLKLTYPMHLILLRGNHESRSMASIYGFSEECKNKLLIDCTEYFCEVFDCMPLCAIVDKKAFCIHAGISKELHSIKDIKDINRFCEIPENGLFCDLLWSDPSKYCKEWKKSERCDTYIWGLEPALKFLEENNLSIIIRGHQVVEEGYEYEFDPNKSVVTIYSSKFANTNPVFMILNKELNYEFKELYSILSEVLQSTNLLSSHEKSIDERENKVSILNGRKNNNIV